MKKNLFLRLCLMIVVALSIYSCRQEFLLQDGDDAGSQSSNYKVYTINRSQVTQDFFLFDKVAKIQTTLSEKKTGSAFGKTAQDSLMDGGNIVIDKVLVVENNGQKTYTFPLKRKYPTSKIENLVLKKNQDSTFSGVLMQYDITPKEKELFNLGHSIDLKSRTKIYDISNLNVSAYGKSYTVNFGCFTMDYQDGWCSEGIHFYTDPDAHKCTADIKPQEPRILSIKEIPGCNNSGSNTGSTGNGTMPSQPSNGGDNGLTLIFDDIDLTYYTSDNMTDPDYLFWSKVTQFVQAQPQTVKNFNNEYHFVYYYIHTYFKNNGGLTQANKNFVSQRLLVLSNWYYDITKASYLNTDQRLSLAIWSEKYLLEHPDITWEEFESRFLTNPCADLNAKSEDAPFKAKMQELYGDSNVNSVETAMVTYNNGQNYGDKSHGSYDSNGSAIAKLDVDWNRAPNITGFMHCHLNNNGPVKSLTVFSMTDFVALAQLVENSTVAIEQMGMYVTSDRGTFAVKLTNKQAIIDFANYIIANEEDVNTVFQKDIKINMTKKQQTKGLLGLIKKSGVATGIELYESDSNFKNWKKLYLDDNNELKDQKCN